MTQLVLIRGLPGSGKSTLAKEFIASNFRHVESDDFFTNFKTGEYSFDPVYLPYAHAYCQARTAQLIRNKLNVVVSNTFTTFDELKPYLKIVKITDSILQVLTTNGEYTSIHNVPDHVIDRMKSRWEDITDKQISDYFKGE